jgi:hypothetical protein
MDPRADFLHLWKRHSGQLKPPRRLAIPFSLSDLSNHSTD